MTKNEQLSYYRTQKARLERLFEPTPDEVAAHREYSAAIEALLTSDD